MLLRYSTRILLAAAFLSNAPAIGQAITRSAPIVGEGNKAIGTLTLTEGPKGVLFRVNASGLPEGWHGMHIHSVGTCADPGFKASGGHVHMTGSASVHGLLNKSQTEEGDLPNLYASQDGKAVMEVFAPNVSLGEAPGRLNLLDEDGSALVIHAAADDHMTQPIGGAGARIACAVIK